jgi:hypothetical protein
VIGEIRCGAFSCPSWARTRTLLIQSPVAQADISDNFVGKRPLPEHRCPPPGRSLPARARRNYGKTTAPSAVATIPVLPRYPWRAPASPQALWRTGISCLPRALTAPHSSEGRKEPEKVPVPLHQPSNARGVKRQEITAVHPLACDIPANIARDVQSCSPVTATGTGSSSSRSPYRRPTSTTRGARGISGSYSAELRIPVPNRPEFRRASLRSRIPSHISWPPATG